MRNKLYKINIKIRSKRHNLVLQSTVNAYDIKEKIKAANEQLFEDYDPEIDFRERKVTFNDSVEYEPYFSSDDSYIQSPRAMANEEEIENIEDLSLYQTIEEDIIEDIQDLKINDEEIAEAEEIEEIKETYEIEDNDNEETVGEFIEEISEDTKSGENVIEIIQDSEFIDETDMEVSIIHCEEETPKLKLPKKKTNQEYIPINCRIHCLEKRDLDIINKGIETENLKIPPELALRLNEKYCCKKSDKVKLPTYNGLNSEYGLTESQIERKRMKTERKLRKNQEKIIRIREERVQKDIYNEEIFRDWLKSISKRKMNKNKNNYQTYEQRRPNSSFEAKISFQWKKVRPKSCPSAKSNTIVLYPGVTLKTVI